MYWPHSITVSTSGFHPDNPSSTLGEVTKYNKISPKGFIFIILYDSRREANEVRPFKEVSEKEKFIFLFPNDAERKGFHDSEILTLGEVTKY